MNHIFIINRDKASQKIIGNCFVEHQVNIFQNRESALNLQIKKCDYIFVDVELLLFSIPSNEPGKIKELLQTFWKCYPGAKLIVLAENQSTRKAVQVVKLGASDYLTYPIVVEEVLYVRENLEESQRIQGELDHLRDQFWQFEVRDLVNTNSPVMKEVLDKMRRVSETKTTVLLTGETGTGKNVFAELMHRHSSRKTKQFINVHCGAISDTLLESELFGHERGAFTGAIKRKLGKFEIADGGTILLDEVGTITPIMQVKLLQVLQDRTFQRVGGENTIFVDVRILAATNLNLKKAVEEGTFRRDLYFRFNVFPIELPPLRERLEDIPLLVQTFIKQFNSLYPKEIVDINPLVMEAFYRYDWPGNVRELESLMERAFLLENSSVLAPKSFPRDLFLNSKSIVALSGLDKPVAPPDSLPSPENREEEYHNISWTNNDEIRSDEKTEEPGADSENDNQAPFDREETLSQVRQRAINQAEKNYLHKQLSKHKGRINSTAKSAGITARQLHKLMTKHSLKKEHYK